MAIPLQADAPLVLEETPDAKIRFGVVSVNGAHGSSDGSVFITGSFDYIDGVPFARFARLQPDGRLDSSFSLPETDGVIGDITSAPDGTLFAVGSFNFINGLPRPALAKLNSDGSLDSVFAPPSPFLPRPGQVFPVSDGGCYVALAEPGNTRVVRLRADGQMSPGHTPITLSWIPSSGGSTAPDGRLALIRNGASGPNGVVAFDANGSPMPLSAAIPTNFRAASLFFDTEGALIVVGQTISAYGANRIRIMPNGQLDPSFTTGAPGSPPLSRVARLSDGSFVAATGSATIAYLFHFSPTGIQQSALPVSNTPSAQASIAALYSLPTGGYLVSGSFTSINSVFSSTLARISNTGEVRQDFFVDLLNRGTIWTMSRWGDGGYLFGGRFSEVEHTAVGHLAILTASDTVQTNAPSLATSSTGVRTLVPTADGGAIALGSFPAFPGTTSVGIAKIRSNGEVDANFLPGVSQIGTNGDGVGLANGQTILAGRFLINTTPSTTHFLIRVNADGSIDPTFNNNSTASGGALATAVGVDSLGRIVVAGGFTMFQGAPRRGLVRTTADGMLDPSFIPAVGLSGGSMPRHITFLPDGRFYIVGVPGNQPASAQSQLLRFNSDGSIDSSFGPLVLGGRLSSYFVAADGWIYLGATDRLLRASASGEIDPTFEYEFNGGIMDIKLDAHGRLLVCGAFTQVNGEHREGLARFSPAIPFGAQIDGASEVTVRLLSSHAFTTTVLGASGEPSYQWFHNGKVIAGATGPTLTLTHIVPKYEGAYTVVVSDDDETVTTEEIQLIVQRGKPAKN